jgi:exodeoxyribonuclease III
MKIVSWNVAGLRAMLKKDVFYEFINDESNNFDIICLQETKAEEHQVKLSEEIIEKYPYRYWNSTDGTTQRKGLSGTSIWCSSPPIKRLENAEFDNEGRILALEFEKFILVNVYVPNSQAYDCERYKFREEWNTKFGIYIKQIQLKLKKDLIICGDMNVAHLDIDISNPKSKKNKVPGFFDNERFDFAYLLETYDMVDVYRDKNPKNQVSTYWSNFLKAPRKKENGWRIDYFLVSKSLYEKGVVGNVEILMDIMGSDHCPLEFTLVNV